MESFTSLWKLMETDGNSWMFFKKWKFKDFLQMDGNSWKLMFKETQRKNDGNSQKPLEIDANS
jgi:hypothetical protein